MLEARGQLEEALREYRRASEFDPPNRQIAGKVIEMERRIRDMAEASRPQPSIQQLREAARQSPEPLLNPASRDPIDVVFNNASLRDILNSIGMSAGHQRHVRARLPGPELHGAAARRHARAGAQADPRGEPAVLQGGQPATIMVIPDNAQKRAQYEEQVIRTFFISHADATELAQMLNTVIRIPALAVAPVIVANKTTNTITVRATANIVADHRADDRAERQAAGRGRHRRPDSRGEPGARQAVRPRPVATSRSTRVFSPETRSARHRRQRRARSRAQPFNLNTITRGISTADFYLSVPSAVVRFLESDSETRLIAKPQLRGAEGQQITLNLGDEIPVPVHGVHAGRRRAARTSTR